MVGRLFTKKSASPTSCIVEFSGIPGAGKSYLARHLADALVSAGTSVDEPLLLVSPHLGWSRRGFRKLRLAALETIGHPVSSARLVVAVAGSGQSPRDFVHRSQNWLVVRSLVRRCRRRPGVHIFEQGIVQELCSIGYLGRWHACLEVAAPGRDDLAPDVIVRVTVPCAVAKQRLAARGGHQSRIEVLDDQAQTQALRIQVDDLDEIERLWFERFGERRGSRRIQVDNGGTGDGAAIAVVLDQLLELLPGR